MAAFAEDSSKVYGDDEIFYGSVPVHFAQVPGDVQAFVAEHWRVDMTEGALEKTLARNGPIAADDR